MNFIQMMHYAQYRFLLEKRNEGSLSSFAAKCTVAALFAFTLSTILDLIGVRYYLFITNYWQGALFIALPCYLVVNFFALKKEEIDDDKNELHLKQGKFYLNIFTFLPILYVVCKLIFSDSNGLGG
jgi:putative Mn2+ efflux pump MntP